MENCQIVNIVLSMSRDMRFPLMWYVRPAEAQTSLRILIQTFAVRLDII